MRTASACAKFLLGGEHSVVYEGRALAIPLPHWRLHVTATEQSGFTLNGKRAPEELQDKVNKALDAMKLKAPAGLECRTDFPPARGLGSSAALCVALVRLLAEEKDPQSLADRAWAGENIFHGTSSGTDPHVVAFEKALAYDPRRKACEIISLEGLEKSGHRFVLEDSGQDHDTAKAVAAVADYRSRDFCHFGDLVESLALNTEQMLFALRAQEWHELGQLMNKSQRFLYDLGVSSPELSEAILRLQNQGALGAKLTGAGHGGFAVGLI